MAAPGGHCRAGGADRFGASIQLRVKALLSEDDRLPAVGAGAHAPEPLERLGFAPGCVTPLVCDCWFGASKRPLLSPDALPTPAPRPLPRGILAHSSPSRASCQTCTTGA